LHIFDLESLMISPTPREDYGYQISVDQHDTYDTVASDPEGSSIPATYDFFRTAKKKKPSKFQKKMEQEEMGWDERDGGMGSAKTHVEDGKAARYDPAQVFCTVPRDGG